MTPSHSASRADRPQTWKSSVDAGEAGLRWAGWGRYADILGAACGYLQAGWRWLLRRRAMQLSSRRLHVAETISLGDKRSVCIVEVDGAQFLIGTSAANVQLLAVLDKTERLSGKKPDAATGWQTREESAS